MEYLDKQKKFFIRTFEHKLTKEDILELEETTKHLPCNTKIYLIAPSIDEKAAEEIRRKGYIFIESKGTVEETFRDFLIYKGLL